MNNTFLVIITALVSGLCATLITLVWQHRTRVYSNKIDIFRTLMSYRYMISDERCVAALNSIDVVFYKDKEIREAYKGFWDETMKPVTSNQNGVILDKFLRLLEEMGKVLGLKDIHWDDIKRDYYPTGLSEKLDGERLLRQLQLKKAMEKNTGYNQQEMTTDVQIAVLNLITELSKNPESLKAVLSFAESYISETKKK